MPGGVVGVRVARAEKRSRMVEEWQPDESERDWETPLFLIAGGVFAERDGKILILKRAGGEMKGG